MSFRLRLTYSNLRTAIEHQTIQSQRNENNESSLSSSPFRKSSSALTRKQRCVCQRSFSGGCSGSAPSEPYRHSILSRLAHLLDFLVDPIDRLLQVLPLDSAQTNSLLAGFLLTRRSIGVELSNIDQELPFELTYIQQPEQERSLRNFQLMGSWDGAGGRGKS